MPRRPLLPAAAALGAALASPAQADAGAAGTTATGTATAAVIAPLAVVREADLDFGTVAVSATAGGTVAIVPLASGARYEGGAEGLCAQACALPHAAQFAVGGEPGRAYQITLPARLAIPVPGAGAGAEVVVDSLVAASASAPGAGHGILSNAGQDRFEVGGTLHLPAAAPAAKYTTQVPVIVQYM